MCKREVETNEGAPLRLEGEVSTKRDWSSSIYSLEIAIRGASTLGIERLPDPGQFYMLYPDESIDHLLGRPLSVHSAGIEDDVLVLGFLVEEVGWGTRRLRRANTGQRVGLLGPLGRGYPKGPESPILVAGGMGIAPLFYLATSLDREGVDYTMLAGYSCGEKVCPDLGCLTGEVSVFTEDGGVGNRGLVSEGAREAMRRGGYDAILTCGPVSMMFEVYRMARGQGISCQVSLAQRMGCGWGLCRSCVVRGNSGQNLSVCRDGPVFDAREIRWSELEASPVDACREA